MQICFDKNVHEIPFIIAATIHLPQSADNSCCNEESICLLERNAVIGTVKTPIIA